MNSMENKKYTIAGTDIEEVKKQNAKSGLSYNQVFEKLAKERKEKADE
ncbi:hypothetical protein EDD69_1313 [Thermolongibacillus altinsuensis]|uniref:DNA mismatch repair protein MutT n=1 Tax=Thermolongibacillus altinsuensis TaxID=575256 RepID=A0A4R1Q5Z9_9BACL|nr:hypothetical protein EDD69_1313 [Thermolongibacillus altinsuensis]